MTIVTVKNKYQVVIPLAVRKQFGINRGDVLEVKTERGKLTYTRKSVIDRVIPAKKIRARPVLLATQGRSPGVVKIHSRRVDSAGHRQAHHAAD